MRKVKFQKIYLDLKIIYIKRGGKKPPRKEFMRVWGKVKLPK